VTLFKGNKAVLKRERLLSPVPTFAENLKFQQMWVLMGTKMPKVSEKPKVSEIFSFWHRRNFLGSAENWVPMGIMSRLIYNTENVSTLFLIF
jgi:hypothetical protein